MNEVAPFRHRWQPLAWLFVGVFGGLAVTGFVVSRSILFALVGLIAVCILPILAKEFLKTLEKSAPIVLGPDGIHTYDGFGVKAFVRWQDIRKTGNMVLWPGLKWILLDDGRGYFKLAGIPVFLADKGAFYREVENLVGADHVVAVALRDNGFPS